MAKKSVTVRTKLPAVRGGNQTVMQAPESRYPGGQHPYQFMTPQKLPLRHQLLNSGNKNSAEAYNSVSGFKYTPVKVNLQEQFRGMTKNDAASKASLRSLPQSFKA